MLWRVRTTLPDRPGALAHLAQACADAGADIRAVQVFPGVEEVTDELVLGTPDDWTDADLHRVVDGAGWHFVDAVECTPDALVDQPTRYVRAVREVLANPAGFPELAARLFDAEAGRAGATSADDTMDMLVADVLVQVRRTTPFTQVERERGVALAELVTEVLRRADPLLQRGGGERRLGGGAVPAYETRGEAVTAYLDGAAVGQAVVEDPDPDDALLRPVSLRVDAAFQRRGIGTRLLVDAARLARDLGAEEIVLATSSDNQAVLPMVLAAGLRGRIRMAGDVLTVRIGVRDLRG